MVFNYLKLGSYITQNSYKNVNKNSGQNMLRHIYKRLDGSTVFPEMKSLTFFEKKNIFGGIYHPKYFLF